MKTVVFTYGKFSNHSDLHKLIIGLSANYITDQEFTLCEYKGFSGVEVEIDNPLFVRLDDAGYAYKFETESKNTLEEVVSTSPGNLVIVTNFMDYKDDILEMHLSNTISAKRITMIYYDDKNRTLILKDNKYIDSVNESIRFEQLNRLARRSRIVLKGDKL